MTKEDFEKVGLHDQEDFEDFIRWWNECSESGKQVALKTGRGGYLNFSALKGRF